MNPIQQTIETVRRQVRYALASETTVRLLVAVGGFFWVWLLIDWLVEPGQDPRVAVYLVAGAALLAWLLRGPLSALLSPLPDGLIAAWIERRRPELGDSLLTSLTADQSDNDPARAALIEASRRRAAGILSKLDSPGVVDSGKLRPWWFAAGAAVVSVLSLLVLSPDAFAVYMRRLALSEERWPRRVSLMVEKFTPDDEGRLTRRVARDSPFELDVQAALTNGHTAPPEVRATIRAADGANSRRNLSAIGEPTSGADAHQAYRMTVEHLKQDVVIRLRGGDDRLGPLYVRVVPRPAVTGIELEVHPPEYLNTRSYRQPADAVDQVAEGSRVTLYATMNKPIERLAATLGRSEAVVAIDARLSEEGRTAIIALPQLKSESVVELSLLDTDGIDGGTPFRLPIRVRADAPPRVDFSLVGVGRAITPDALIQTSIQIDDDHAVGHSLLRLLVGELLHDFSLTVEGDASATLTAGPSLDLLALRSDPAVRLPRLEPGQRLQLLVTATDFYDLNAYDPSAAPHDSVSQTETLTIVTPDELVARLEEREVNLRRTFEQVCDEARGAELSAERLDDKGAEPDDAPPEDRSRRRRLQMARLVEQVSKATDETAAVAKGFQGIHQELVNNRIPNDDLKDRIEGRIVQPLERLVRDSLPGLQSSLQQAAASLDQDGPALPAETRRQLAGVVRDMQAALGEMKAVETYNEVLAMLRGIIQDQRDLSRKTEDAKKSSLKRLLLD